MHFSDLKLILKEAKVVGKLPKKKIKYISDHSKNVDKNTLLVVDQNKNFKVSFLKEAISKNLNTIITNRFLENLSINQVIVRNLDNEVFKLLKLRQPYIPKVSVAITGTNGKTSSSWYLAQICKINKIPTKLTGTLGYFKNLKKNKDSQLTTPSNLDLCQFAYSSKKNKFSFISEASSHGLHQGRFNNFNVDIAAITNLSHDHLDYHKNYKSYVKSKMKLFNKILNTKGIAAINSRLKNYNSLKKYLMKQKTKIITFGSKDVYFYEDDNLYLYVFGKKYILKKFELLNNIKKENLECAIACALAMKIDINKIIKCLSKLKSAPGRFEIINYKKKKSKIVIDYAHTPDALENILKSFSKNKFKPSVVFGCGGNRDKEKRKKMAVIAKKFANKVYITDDNPRDENPKIIRKVIKKYCPKGIEIPNRKKAIYEAIQKLDINDTLVIAGKGHEKFQFIKDKKIKFDDYKIVKNFIE